MSFPRSSGILLHPTSLPSAYGIGDLGPEAHRFADFLRDAGQRIWQVLPLGPTGYGDSPYQCFSAFAGNPLLISLDALSGARLPRFTRPGIAPRISRQPGGFRRRDRLEAPVAAATRSARSSRVRRPSAQHFAAFCQTHSSWLDEFALFMALKEAHNNVAWTQWEPELALRKPDAIERARNQLRDEIECHKFIQFEFERQWRDLKAHCAARRHSHHGRRAHLCRLR